jgi:hypothetical protein
MGLTAAKAVALRKMTQGKQAAALQEQNKFKRNAVALF